MSRHPEAIGNGQGRRRGRVVTVEIEGCGLRPWKKPTGIGGTVENQEEERAVKYRLAGV